MIAQKTRYALRSLLFLAEEQGGAPVQLSRIAETQRVPPKYLELIMLDLKKAGLEQVVRERVAAGVPFLGVCVGMQLLFDESEEDGVHPGLGLIPGRVVRFAGKGLKVPQIGWNQVTFTKPDPLLEGIPDGSYFYFVHSYYPTLSKGADELGGAEYGEHFSAVVRRGNVWGAQFHPEKSQDAGLRMLKNFATLQLA